MFGLKHRAFYEVVVYDVQTGRHVVLKMDRLNARRLGNIISSLDNGEFPGDLIPEIEFMEMYWGGDNDTEEDSGGQDPHE